MWSRWLFNLLAVLALVALALTASFFHREYQALGKRSEVLSSLRELAAVDGPCAALSAARKLKVDHQTYATVGFTLESLRREFAQSVVGEDDARSRSALLSADDDGLIDRQLCEQVALTRDLGETHPVMTMLRFTRQGGEPCGEEAALVHALNGLGSHRTMMVHALLGDMPRLECISPILARPLAQAAMQLLAAQPRALDDRDAFRVAAFLQRWAPERAAQFACGVEVRGTVSALGNLIGCTPLARGRLLSRYRTLKELVHDDGVSPERVGSEVLLLNRHVGAELCDVMTQRDVPTLHTVPCGDLLLISDVHVAVRIEPVAYGAVRADLIAGLASFDGRSGRILRTSKHAPFKTWFAFDRAGNGLGSVDMVSLQTLAAQVGESVPASPLRAFCRQAGARYCYDVDWAELVRPAPGEPVIFLSRPADGVFLPTALLGLEHEETLITAAFGSETPTHAKVRIYRLSNGRHLLAAVGREGVEVRWQLDGQRFGRQSFGVGEGGAAPPLARLIAAMDLQGNGMPELVVQRVAREEVDGALRAINDEVLLLTYAASKERFEPLNRLTVHEY